MVYRNLECPNENAWKWHDVNDIKDKDNSILQSVLNQLKNRITHILLDGGINKETVKQYLDEYTPDIEGIQTIYCPSCHRLQVDIIMNAKTKIKDNLWLSYEIDRFIKEVKGNGR